MSGFFVNKIDYENEKKNAVYNINNFCTLPFISNNNLNIAILYIGIGKYKKFWSDFYNTCEKYFLPNHIKQYFLFTDNIEDLNNKNVTEIYQKDLGWPGNTLYRFQMFLKVKEELEKYDFIYFFNGNTLFLQTINDEEIIPTNEENYLVALSWDIYKNRETKDYPYDRNPKSSAYIPLEEGHFYYQGGLNGGRAQEYINLMIECNKQIELDDANKIIAKNHDESHINKYLLNKEIKVLGSLYGNPEEWTETNSPKIIFRNKNQLLGEKTINKLKKRNIIWKVKNKLRYFIEELSESTEIIFLQGGLGNQMFQYAFYLSRKSLGKNVIYETSILSKDKNHNGYELERVFNIKELRSPIFYFILCMINYANACNSTIIKWWNKILYNVGIQLISDDFFTKKNTQRSIKRINLYKGYWQTEKYFDSFQTDVRNVFTFDQSKLSKESIEILAIINKTISVSIHIRRGDYLLNSDLYGNICTEKYYKDAISIMNEKAPNATLFVFSDDMNWVKENFKLNNAFFIEFNSYNNSWQDMFLMSSCKHNIIANSTFSWWGAWLNKNPHKIVISPKKFDNCNLTPDIVPESWLVI